jgi:MSHA biogenesis protein MshL
MIAAIGGLMRQQQSNIRSGLPGTTDKGLGVLTGQRDHTLTKSELIILLKVTVIKGESSWQQQGQEINERVRDLRRPYEERR